MLKRALIIAAATLAPLAGCSEPYIAASTEQGVLFEEVDAYNNNSLQEIANAECAKHGKQAQLFHHGGDYALYECRKEEDLRPPEPDVNPFLRD